MNTAEYIPLQQRALHQHGIRTLLLVQFCIVLPFLVYLPNWLLAVFVLVAFWRWRVLHGQMKKPPRSLIILAIGIGIAGLMMSGFGRYSLDSAVALCVFGYLLKSLEVLRRRDGVFQVYLGYFLMGVYLLYRFDLIAALQLIALLIINTIALQAVTSEVRFDIRYALKQSSVLVFGAIPVMIVGYLFFPRLPPLWQIPNDERGSETGMTDEITPGSVAELAMSTDPAFRVSFDGELPERSQWYWRGNTMSRFDGVSWYAEYRVNRAFPRNLNADLPRPLANQMDYSVIMENSGQRWLYFLDWPVSIQGENLAVLPDGRAASIVPLTSNMRYRARSSSDVLWPDQSFMVSQSRQLPASGNEPLRQWALNQRATVASDQAFLSLIFDHIRNNEYFYTLQPPQYEGENSLADFWLNGRRGFCSHYASAVGYILRAAGIPARLVGGYQGGTYNRTGDYIQVRQMEAHVWVEVWIDNRWQRFDPTVAVSPFRVERNLDDLFAESQPGELSLLTRVNRIGLVNQLSLYWDSINYRWQNMVLNYDNEQALGWFENAFGQLTPLKAALAAAAFMATMALIFALSFGLIALPVRRSPAERILNGLERKLGPRHPGETLRDYAQRQRHRVTEPEVVDQLVQQLESMIYRGSPGTEIDAALKAVRHMQLNPDEGLEQRS